MTKAKNVSKELWIELFREVGLDDEAMSRWHAAFERRAPQGHEAFLEWLGVEQGERQAIRQRAQR